MKWRQTGISFFTFRMLLITMAGTLSISSLTTLANVSPVLPKVFIDTTYSAPAGNTIPVNSGGNFQAALNKAQPGDTIVLEAGATYTGNFTLPNKTSGIGWIYIISSELDKLPGPGRRINPKDASNMPKIMSGNVNAAIKADPGAHHFRFAGIEFTTTHASPEVVTYSLIDLGYAGQADISECANHITLDRCYLHGTQYGSMQRALIANSATTAVIDSYFSEIKALCLEAQCILAYNGPGPFKIHNNYLEGAGENVMFGGAASNAASMLPCDIEVTNNYFYKQKWWMNEVPRLEHLEPWQRRYCIKNLLELKAAKRVMISGNIFQNNWAQSQNGYAILFTPRGQNPACAQWIVVEDVTLENNIIKEVDHGINLLGTDDRFPMVHAKRIAMRNNLFLNLGNQLQVLSGAEDITFDHNTAFQSQRMLVSGGAPSRDFVYTNNISNIGNYGVIGTGKGQGTATLSYYFPGCDFSKNVLIGGVSSTYPANNYFPANISRAGFADYANGDYRLAAQSAYCKAGTDGADIGVDMDVIDAATNGVDGDRGFLKMNGLEP